MTRIAINSAVCALTLCACLLSTGCQVVRGEWTDKTHSVRPLSAPAWNLQVLKAGVTMSFAVVVPPLVDQVETRFEDSVAKVVPVGTFRTDVTDNEHLRDPAFTNLRLAMVSAFRQSALFGSVAASVPDEESEVIAQVTVLDLVISERTTMDVDRFSREPESKPAVHRGEGEAKCAIQITFKDRENTWQRTFRHVKTMQLDPNQWRDRAQHAEVNEKDARQFFKAFMNELIAKIAADQELLAHAKSIEQVRLASAGGVVLPTVRFLEPTHTEVTATSLSVECRVESKVPLAGVEFRVNSRVVAGVSRESKAVGVRNRKNGVAIEWTEEGASITGEVTLDAGRNLLEVLTTLPGGQSSKEVMLITNIGKGVDRKPIGQRWAVIVGINDYRYAQQGIPPLRYAVKDARAVYDFMRSPQGGAFPTSNMRLLLNEQATTAALREAVFEFLAQAQEDDFVLLYLSCHGAPAPGRPDNLYLITHDTNPEKMASTGLPMWDIETALKRQIRADRVLVLTDACHSAGVGGLAGTRAAGSNLINKFMQQLADTKPGRAIFTASEANELSFEGKNYGGGHGAFTHYLLEGMAGTADEDGDGVVTLGEAVEYTRDKVRRATKGKQHPDTAGKFDRDLPLSVVK